MLYDVKAKITKNKKLTPSVYYLELQVAKIAAKLKPGQFLHMRIGTGVDPLLRRPFSVNQVRYDKSKNKYNVGIIYKVVGKGTKILKETAVGGTVDVLGPLGNGFDITAKQKGKQPIILVAGGMGVAPLLFLAKTLRAGKNLHAFIGTDTKTELVCVQDFKKLGCKVVVSTDDGSLGYKGYVSQLFENYMKKQVASSKKREPKKFNPYIYACGPVPMLKALRLIANKYDLEGQVSVDEMMGCGLGACLGCVIKVRGINKIDGQTAEYKRICKDGPVFDINEIIWED